MIENENENATNEMEKVPYQRALLVAVYLKPDQKTTSEDHLNELAQLSITYGLEVVGQVPCHVRKFDPATCITKGKLEELAVLAKEKQAEVVIFDDEISPAQQRNLERLFAVSVIDRTELILGVFGQRAHTKEARLQVELAQVRYQLPRLKRLWTHLSRQRGTGGGGYLKGEGEKQIEIDRRILKRRIDQLQEELTEVRGHRETRRNARERSGVPVFAIVGYTNAGKSTLLNALTNAGVLVEDKLFATLDPTTRKYMLPNNQEILLVDTVGFIRKLPHLLVAAFKSTLEEAVEADILLHVVDVSHPQAEEQIEITHQVLEELGAKNKPMILLLNKIDRCPQTPLRNRLRLKYPNTIAVSAMYGIGFEELQEVMVRTLSHQRRRVQLRVPQSDYSVVSEVMRAGKVLSQHYEENDVIVHAEIPFPLVGKLQKYCYD